MAITAAKFNDTSFVKFDRHGFGQIEPNQVWFTRTGAVEAQSALTTDEFASHFPMLPEEFDDNKTYAELGAFLAIDKMNMVNGVGTARIPSTATDEAGCPIGINYSTEHIYNQYTPGRRNFCMIADEFYPRVGFVSVGERFTTNTVCFKKGNDLINNNKDENEKIDWKAVCQTLAADLKAGTTYYGVVLDGSEGNLVISDSTDGALGNVYTKVTKVYTNADGTPSFMFQIINPVKKE